MDKLLAAYARQSPYTAHDVERRARTVLTPTEYAVVGRLVGFPSDGRSYSSRTELAEALSIPIDKIHHMETESLIKLANDFAVEGSRDSKQGGKLRHLKGAYRLRELLAYTGQGECGIEQPRLDSKTRTLLRKDLGEFAGDIDTAESTNKIAAGNVAKLLRALYMQPLYAVKRGNDSSRILRRVVDVYRLTLPEMSSFAGREGLSFGARTMMELERQFLSQGLPAIDDVQE